YGWTDLADHGLHVALMGFVRAVHIEKFEAGPLRRPRPFADGVVDHPAVNEVLAPAIGIEGPQPGESRGGLVIPKTGGAVPIGGGRRGVDEARAVRRAPLP